MKLKATELWNDEDTQYLKDYWHVSTYEDLAYALDKTLLQVQSRIQYMQENGIVQRKKKTKVWTLEEENFIKRNHTKLSMRELAKELDRTKDTTGQKILRMRKQGKLGYLNQNKSPKGVGRL